MIVAEWWMVSRTEEWTVTLRQSELTARTRMRKKREVKAQPWRGLRPGERGRRRTT